jgi:hypothetical protein
MATNLLVFASAPVNLWYSTNLPPSTNSAGDAMLLSNSMGGTAVVTTASTPALVPGSTYYLGVQNLNSAAVDEAIQVHFHYLSANVSDFGVIHTNLAGTNGYLAHWTAPAGEQFHLQWMPKLVPASWMNFNGVISYISLSTTNGEYQYFDDGSQTGGFGATRYYRLLWLDSPTNTAPFFARAPSSFYFAYPLVTFVYTNLARDWDIPPQTLAYELSNSLTGNNLATINSEGVISWTPTFAQVGLTNVITTTVTDSGVPMGNVENSFAVIISTNFVAPAFGEITANASGVTFDWFAPTNEQFEIRWTTNLASPNWQIFPGPITSMTTNFTYVDTNTPLVKMKFYQLILLP